MKLLADAIGLRTFRFCGRVLDPLEVQVQRKLVVLAVTAVFAASVGQYPEKWHTVVFVAGQHFVVEQVRSNSPAITVLDEVGDQSLISSSRS
jgi:hypothetical protein